MCTPGASSYGPGVPMTHERAGEVPCSVTTLGGAMSIDPTTHLVLHRARSAELRQAARDADLGRQPGVPAARTRAARERQPVLLWSLSCASPPSSRASAW